MLKFWGITAILSLAMLTGCSNAPEEPQKAPIQKTDVKAFEEQPEIGSEEEKDALAAVSDGLASVYSKDPKINARAKNMLIDAAEFSEGSKGSRGYSTDLYFIPGHGSDVRTSYIKKLSSSESYCILAEIPDGEDPLFMLYDSQQKKVLEEGKTCKPAKGSAWNSD